MSMGLEIPLFIYSFMFPLRVFSVVQRAGSFRHAISVKHTQTLNNINILPNYELKFSCVCVFSLGSCDMTPQLLQTSSHLPSLPPSTVMSLRSGTRFTVFVLMHPPPHPNAFLLLLCCPYGKLCCAGQLAITYCDT